MRTGQICRNGAVLAVRAACARSLGERLRGLLGRRGLGPGSALVIERCGAVHTLGMRFAIDLIFLDRAWRVVRLVRNVPPGRMLVWGGWRAVRVIESETGCLAVEGIQVNDCLVWTDEINVENSGAK